LAETDGSGSMCVEDDIMGGLEGVELPLDDPVVAAGPVGLAPTGSPFPGVLLVVQPKAASDAASENASSVRPVERSAKLLCLSVLRMWPPIEFRWLFRATDVPSLAGTGIALLNFVKEAFEV
jgi:hypothetical protein